MDLKQLQKNWDEFGKTDPLWAILTSPDRKGGKWDPEEFFAQVMADIRAGKTSTKIVQTGMGSVLRVMEQPMQGGGWVAPSKTLPNGKRLKRRFPIWRATML